MVVVRGPGREGRVHGGGISKAVAQVLAARLAAKARLVLRRLDCAYAVAVHCSDCFEAALPAMQQVVQHR
jgi:hypothetical protein